MYNILHMSPLRHISASDKGRLSLAGSDATAGEIQPKTSGNITNRTICQQKVNKIYINGDRYIKYKSNSRCYAVCRYFKQGNTEVTHFRIRRYNYAR